MKGKITIGKVTCCGEPENDYVSIKIEDTRSSIEFVSVKMDIESFSRLLFGQASMPVEFEIRGIDRLGKKFEYKTEEVKILHRKHDCAGTGDIDIALSKHEVDGWVGDRSDCSNMHKRVAYTDNYVTYRVCFRRWVDVEDTNEG